MNKNQMVQGWEKKMDAGLVSTGIPERMWDGIKSWVIYGRPAGSFLMSVFTNNLSGAVANTDYENRRILHHYVIFLFNHAPIGCHSSEEATQAWSKMGGLLGGPGNQESG